jgi:nucleotide-binding universal stress UspA family protein
MLATDGTSRGGAPVLAARLLAARLDLPLQVVSVVGPAPIYASAPDLVIPLDRAIDEARCDARETVVSDYVSRFSGGATPPRVHVMFGDVSSEIGAFARRVSATIVVVGSAPHRRFGHVVAGNRAAHVLRSAPCPVLSVPPAFTALPRTVVAAVDFGPSSVRAAQAALLLVAPGGTVVMTHVLPPMEPAALSGATGRDAAADVPARFDRLRDALAPCVPAGVTIETRCVTADPAEGILAAADDADGELIAVGTHGPGLAARALLGSVAERVLHDAQLAVLASPPNPSALHSLEWPVTDRR